MTRRACLLLAVTAAAALAPQPTTRERPLSKLKKRLRKQRLLRVTADRTNEGGTQRRYASRRELLGTASPRPQPFRWTSTPFRVGSVGAFFLLYPVVWAAAEQLPPPNAVEGGYFFSLMSIVFGTLTASTISDAAGRLAALRAAAVEECTLMLPLVKRLEVVLVLDKDRPALGPDVFAAVADRLWSHSADLLGGTRERELELISAGADGLSEITQILQQAQCSLGDEADVTFALDLCGRLGEARGVRLSLENSGVPEVQYSVLSTLSIALASAYTYLTLDRGPLAGVAPHLLGVSLDAGNVVFDENFGVHALFALVCAALLTFNALARDFNLPFSGVFRLESSTVAASLKQLRAATAPYRDKSQTCTTWTSEVKFD